MRFSRIILAALALSVQVVSAWAQDAPAPPARHYPRTSLGLTLGWGAPYGWGLDVSHLITRRLDLNAGVGANITGLKVGVGAT